MRAFKVIVSCAAFATVASTALAQGERPEREQPSGERPARGPRPEGGGGGRQALSPEKAKAAWELQATGVSKRLTLDAEKTKAVVKAYTEARESYIKAQEKMMADIREKMQDSEDQRAAMTEMRTAMENLNKTEREKLEKSLKATITEEQTTKAIASLGTYNRQWDVMVDTVAGFKLAADKQQTALEAIEDYVIGQTKLPRPTPDGDQEAARTAAQELRTKLTDAMKKVLDEEQQKKFEEATRVRGRGGRPGGGGGGGRDRDR